MASRKPPRPPKRLFHRSARPAIPPGSLVVSNPPGELKMSEILGDFVDPYLAEDPSESDYRGMLRIGVLAWNAAMLPADRRAGFLDGIAAEEEASLDFVAPVMTELVREMIARKLALYPDVRRQIISFELTRTDREYRLSVASTPSEDAPPETSPGASPGP